jgi:hypothetical protein
VYNDDAEWIRKSRQIFGGSFHIFSTCLENDSRKNNVNFSLSPAIVFNNRLEKKNVNETIFSSVYFGAKY